MKKLTIAMLVLASLPLGLLAQDVKKEKIEREEIIEKKELAEDKERPERKETQEIIIRQNGDKEVKLKVEVDGDKITVNGKPLSEFKDKDITINKRKMTITDGDHVMSFNIPSEGWEKFGENFGQQFGENFEKQWEQQDEKAAFLGVTTETEGNGVKIIEVVKGSAAEKAGLKKDDVVTEIGGKKVTNTDEAREELMENAEKSSYTIKAKRNGTEMSFDIKIPKKLKTANL